MSINAFVCAMSQISQIDIQADRSKYPFDISECKFYSSRPLQQIYYQIIRIKTTSKHLSERCLKFVKEIYVQVESNTLLMLHNVN